MSVIVRVPTILRSYTGGEAEVTGSGATLRDVIADIETRMRRIIAGKHPFVYREVSAAESARLRDEIKRTCKQWHGLREIENVDAVARAEDIRLHTRVPTVCLVAEMGPSFKQLLHGYDRCRHGTSPSG